MGLTEQATSAVAVVAKRASAVDYGTMSNKRAPFIFRQIGLSLGVPDCLNAVRTYS